MPSAWQFQRDPNHCNMLGPGQPSPVQHYSGSSREKNLPGFDDKVTGAAAAPLWPQALWLNQSTNPGQYQSPLFTRRNGPRRACLVKENKAGPSRGQEEEAEQEGTTQSLSLRELWDMQKDFSHHPGEQVNT